MAGGCQRKLPEERCVESLDTGDSLTVIQDFLRPSNTRFATFMTAITNQTPPAMKRLLKRTKRSPYRDDAPAATSVA